MWKVGPYGQKLLAKKEKREESNLHLEKLENKVSCQGNTEGVRDMQYILWLLREV